ncbi:LytR family transcriptional regulator [Exiguobacterium sp. SH1S21]|uniref:LCP family protein n=1 Tax=Exiguobacterium sp. SH1S21 TaxID=2510953 RepID=UPI00103E0C46|nr:LCP family protein [Exiguobacterium sp. SH1S21]TCI53322.1 LytR family transcriptional regulator [Exiguobacterium sp. SH1S21]
MNDDQQLSRVERRRRELERERLEELSRDEQVNPVEAEDEVIRPSAESKQAEGQDHPFLDRSDEKRTETNNNRKRKVQVPKLKMPFGKKAKRQKRDDKREPRSRDTRAHEPKQQSSVPPKQKPQKDKRKRRSWKGKLLLVLLLLVIGVGYMASNPVTFLVMGSDARVGESVSGSRTDSLQLMEFVPRSRTVQNVSIPRDTYTAIPCEPEREGDKITHAFAYGGAECTVGAVEGLTEASVDGQVVITFETFMELIDVVGGVNITATHSFSEKGFNQTYEYTEGVSYSMDGDMALAYARHRKSDTDGARSSRQTEVMSAVADKLVSPAGWSKIPATYSFMKDEMGLEMNPLQMASIGLTMMLQPEVNKLQVDGQDAYIDDIYYYQPNEESVQSIRDALDLTMWGTVR